MSLSNKNKFSLFAVINVIVLSLVIVSTIYPFLNLLSTSVSTAANIAAGKITFYPQGFHLEAYRALLKEPLFWIGYKNTVIYAVTGTIFSVFLTILCSYVISRKSLPGRKVLTMFFVLTMFINGGMIPTYLVVRSLGIRDTIWAILLPNAIDTFFMIIMRTYFLNIPDSLEEAAKIDGMRPTGILFRIFLPLAKPVIATVTLFYAVYKWNMWFKPLLYLNRPELYPITLFLRNIIFADQLSLVDSGSTKDAAQIYMTIKSSAIILVVAPILFVYPYAQKFFVSGVMLGSIKE